MKRYVMIVLIGIVALGFTGCGKTEKWKVDSYNEVLKSEEYSTGSLDFSENIEFFEKHTDLFPSSKEEYEKYLDKDLTLDEVLDTKNFKSPTLFKGKLDYLFGRLVSEKDGGFTYILENYRDDKSSGINVLLFSDEKIDFKSGDTVKVTVLPCKVFPGYTGNDQYREGEFSKGITFDKVLFGVATEYEILN